MFGRVIGIALTVIFCLAAIDFLGRTFQIIGVVMLGTACIIADLKGGINYACINE